MTSSEALQQSASGLTPIEDALAYLLSKMPQWEETESLSLHAALHRMLAEDLHAPLSVPPFANSAMDGYALCAEVAQDPNRTIPITQRIAAGQMGSPLAPGSAARIFTGAPLPEGADAVVMQENCTIDGDEIRIQKAVVPQENVRPAGADIEVGSLLFSKGRRLRPQDIGALASLGLTDVKVMRQPIVALMTTGDELQRPGEVLKAGQIYDSNFSTLRSLLTGLGATVIDCGRVGDTLIETRQALSDAAQRADCVITTGGVSVGEEDHVRNAIEELGQVDLWRLAVKPGKPFAYGEISSTANDRACQFFGLPGNPVSAFVTFVLLVRPCLLAMQGASDLNPKHFPVRSGFSRVAGGIRQEYLRAVLEQTPQGLMATPLFNQSSGVAASLSRSDGLLIVPPHIEVEQGDILQFLPFSELGA